MQVHNAHNSDPAVAGTGVAVVVWRASAHSSSSAVGALSSRAEPPRVVPEEAERQTTEPDRWSGRFPLVTTLQNSG